MTLAARLAVHRAAPFPPEATRVELVGVDLERLDADLTALVARMAAGAALEPAAAAQLARLQAELVRVIPQMPDEVAGYFVELAELGGAYRSHANREH